MKYRTHLGICGLLFTAALAGLLAGLEESQLLKRLAGNAVDAAGHVRGTRTDGDEAVRNRPANAVATVISRGATSASTTVCRTSRWSSWKVCERWWIPSIPKRS